ncbi:MAG: beta-mannosidase, partial [Bacteroidota bacterium]|nr:beta-mannosidase [Bacteroidota bacterium]
LRAVFRPVLEWTKKQADADPRITWAAGEDGSKATWKGTLFYSRKEASDYGWDWGIRLLSCGIWKSVRLVGYDAGRITQLGIRQDITDPKEALLFVSAETETYQAGNFSIDFEVMLHDTLISTISKPVINGKAEGTLSIAEPELWWPNGLGAHPLYTVRAILKSEEKTVHNRQVKTGLRTIEIAREKDERGETFGIKVNGELIFCKGANWIPADAMTGRLTESRYRHLLGSCVDANMNMLRIWGGGLYEPDVFYEFCDENGLMIWHDFMFASGPYLATEPYLENVKAEIKNVVLRRRHHPSIALWCGNNEQEVNMSAGRSLIANHPAVSWEEFDKVFYEAIPQTAALYDPDRPYWPGSPHSPLDRERKRPDFETASGDAHIWDVWHGEQPFSWYEENKDFRFVSEYGFQSLPALETVRSFTAPEDRYFISYIMDHHNMAGKKSQGTENMGNIKLAKYTASMFRMPNNFEDWIYVTQIMHGEGMKVGSEAYRRNFPGTTGALYWQVDDNWPTISGSGMDYYGRWKALQYMVRHFFNPVLVSGVAKDGKVMIYGSNELLQENLCNLEWILYKFDGTVLKSGTTNTRLQANTSMLLETLDFSDVVNEPPELTTYRKDKYTNRLDVFLSIKLVQGDTILSSNIVTFAPPKYWQLQDPEIKYTLVLENGRKKITITAKKFAAYVELGVNDSYAQFSDNYFHLIPGETKTIYVNSSEVPDKEFKKGFFVRSLIDTY